MGIGLDSPLSSSSLFSKFFTFPFQNLQGFISYLKRSYFDLTIVMKLSTKEISFLTWVKLSKCYWESLPPSFVIEHDLFPLESGLHVTLHHCCLEEGMTHTPTFFCIEPNKWKWGGDFVHLCDALGRSSWILVCEYSALNPKYLITLILKLLLTFINDFFFLKSK